MRRGFIVSNFRRVDFERHVSLPPGPYAAVRSSAADGCLTIVLEKLGALGD